MIKKNTKKIGCLGFSKIKNGEIIKINKKKEEIK